MARLNVVTGATGLVGSHIVEHLAGRGERVRALVRPTSETTFLRNQRAELAAGDLHDPESLRRAVAGAEVVYHCAARVSDWGPWARFQADTVDAAANIVRACRAEGVRRFVHVSSIAVYGRPRAKDGEVTEEAALGQHLWLWDNYGRAKIRAEEVVREVDPAATIVRPVWVYGPRDRASMPRVIAALRAGRVPIIGSGRNPLNVLYAGDVAEGAILAATAPQARGQAYNLSSAGEVTQVELLNTLTDALGLPPVRRRVPFFLAMRAAFLTELFGRLLRRPNPPTLTRKAVSLVGRSTQYSTQKARTQLGWAPRVDIREGVRRTLAWFLGPAAPANVAAAGS
jgi:nucleoside-diphosphate-sugar epimerase